MTCPNCGTNNVDGSSFCIKCGANLNPTQSTIQTSVETNQNVNNMNLQQQLQPQTNNAQTNNNQQVQPIATETSSSASTLNYLMYIIAIILKPLKTFKEEESKLNNSKISFVLTFVVSGVMTIINLINTIFVTVRVANYSWTDGYKYSWQWSNIKNIKWIEVIGRNFLIYAGIIFVVAIVFYLGGLIIKKQVSFIKLLSISATAVIPAIIGIMILSPLAGKIWSPLSIVFMVVGAVYSFVILYELINGELKLEGDTKVYFNLICIGILAIVGYYAYMRLLMSSITGGLDNIMDYFK